MFAVMTEPARVRMVLVVDEDLRDALRLRAAKDRSEMSEIVADLLREYLAEELRELQARPAAGSDKKPKKKQ